MLNFIIILSLKKLEDDLVMVGKYLCEGREDTGGISRLEDKIVTDASAGQ